jgi:hypothetical protein
MANLSTNPIRMYKQKEKLTWKKFSKQAHLSVQSLIALSHLLPESMTNIKLGTAVELKRRTGIDLFKYLIKE